MQCSPDGSIACGLHRAYRRPDGQTLYTVNGEHASSYAPGKSLWLEFRLPDNHIPSLYHKKILKRLRALKPEARALVLQSAATTPLDWVLSDLLDGNYENRAGMGEPSTTSRITPAPSPAFSSSPSARSNAGLVSSQHSPIRRNVPTEGSEIHRAQIGSTPTAPRTAMRTPVSITTTTHAQAPPQRMSLLERRKARAGPIGPE